MKDYTEIAVVLDRSGSMSSIADDTIGGFNEFLKGQKEFPGEAKISLYQFDDVYEPVYEGKDIKEAPELTNKTYKPRGCTALFDAVGKTVNSLGDRLSKLPEEERPNKVVVAIITDGFENASKEFTRERIKEMLEHQTNVYKWLFVFLGANQDAVTTGGSYGFSGNNSMTFASNTAGVGSTFVSFGTGISGYRGFSGTSGTSGAAGEYLAKNSFFSTEDRKAQEEAAKTTSV